MEMFSLLWLYITIALAVVVNGFTVNGVHAGVDPKTGFRPFRLEIKDFQYAGPAFDLYILALRKFMDANKTDPLSFFQIAGRFPSMIDAKFFLRPYLSDYILIHFKESMDIPMYRGILFKQLEILNMSLDIANISLFCFSRGIDRTWPW